MEEDKTITNCNDDDKTLTVDKGNDQSLTVGDIENNTVDQINVLYKSKVDNRVYNIYNIVVQNVNLCNAMQGESTNSAYERNVLKSISNITTELDNVVGIIKEIRYDNKQKRDVMYIGNVFWRNIYLTNHLVVSLSVKKGKSVQDYEKGSVINFNCKIESYESNTPERYMKYGIRKIKVTRVLHSTINKFDVDPLEPGNYRYDDWCSVYSKEMDSRDLLKVINKIQWITLDRTDFPQNFFINILLNLHFAENYEKLMIAHQNDYNYLCDVTKSIYVPMCWLLYILEASEYVDPYTIMCFLVQMYKLFIKDIAVDIVKESTIYSSDIANVMDRHYRTLDGIKNFDSLYINIMSLIK